MQRLPLGHLHGRAPAPLRLARRRDHAALRAPARLHAAGPALRLRHRQRQLSLPPLAQGTGHLYIVSSYSIPVTKPDFMCLEVIN